MSKIENRCIAYIYNEMDPSERLEFERELQSDENLLIELESLKRIAGNLNGLNCIEPPDSVINSIKSRAESEIQNSSDFGSFKYLFISAAVTLLAVMIYGGVLLQNQQTPNESDANESDQSISSISVPGNVSGTPADIKRGSEEISPWVDHGEAIHFHERFNRGSVASVDSMFDNSFNKLTRVNSSGTLQQVQQQIHLTGGSR